MKKVMIGILILIPIIIVFIVAMVSMIVSMQAWIAVEDLQLVYKGTEDEAESLEYLLEDVKDKTINFNDVLDVIILPEKANRYVIEWSIVGTITYMDEEYKGEYDKYLQEYSALRAEIEAVYPDFSDPDQQTAFQNASYKYGSVTDSSLIISEMANQLLNRVWPAVTLLDEYGDETANNTSGKFKLSSYCSFTVKCSAENVSKTVFVTVGGDDVKSVTLSNVQGDTSNTLSVGESKRITASYMPVDSIVNYTTWTALNPDIATIDQNGVITAKKEGSASFTMNASVHSSEKSGNIQYVTSNVYTINIVASDGLSSIYGNSVMLSKSRSYTLENLGISESENNLAVEGATIVNGALSINNGASVVTISNGNKTFTINLCEDNAIKIANAAYYSKDSGYVLGVDDISLKLIAVWADVMRTDALEGVVWTSDNTAVATVQNGEVKGVSNGEVTITASKGGDITASITLKVHTKTKYVQLRTSDEALAVGLAKETVFASERYVDIASGNAKEANYTNITVVGEPKRNSDMSDEDYADKLNEFYSAYTFSIVEGGEYATIDGNKLTFIPSAIVADNKTDENGNLINGDVVVRRTIKVQVVAKYPRHEGVSKYNVKTVNIQVVHGVAVYNMNQLQQAVKDQRTYAGADVFDGVNGDSLDAVLERCAQNSNIIPSTITFEHTNGDDVYQVWTDPRSKRTYSICLMANCAFDTEKDSDGKPVHIVKRAERLKVYGNVYGNNHMISALTGQMDTDTLYVAWSDVTVSNVIIRANENPENGEIQDANDTKTYTGNAVKVGSDIDDWDYYRCLNVQFEYTILENAELGIHCYNTDLTLNSCIFRNFPECAVTVQQKMAVDDYGIVHPIYNHLFINNIVSSNTLGSVVLAYYNQFMQIAKKGRFVKDDLTKNEQYYLDNFMPYGINLEITQTGFFDAYNWQNVDYTAMIKTTIESADQLIAQEGGQVLRTDPVFENYRYVDDDNKCYVHYAFVIAAMSVDGLKFTVEPTHPKITLENTELNEINSGDVTVDGIGASLLRSLDVKIFSYMNNASIMPYSTYQVNQALIDRMHS